MLKFLSSRKILPTHLSSPLRAAITDRVYRGSGFCQKTFFNSEARAADDGINSSATGHGLDNCSTVLVIPRQDRPMLLGHHEEYCDVKDPLFSTLLERYKLGQAPYVCVALLKDPAESESSMHEVKGKKLFDRLHKVGTLSKIKFFWGGSLHLIGLRPVRITEMVSEDLLTVKVDHLKDLPYDEEDAIMKATFCAVRSALKNYLVNEDVPKILKRVDDSNCQELAYYGAGLFMSTKLELQAVLEELDVHKRLHLTLEIVKKAEEIRNRFRKKYRRIHRGKGAEPASGLDCNV